MKSISADLRRENERLDAFVCGQPDGFWRAPTAFYGWDARDEILHLYFTDLLAVAAIEEPARYKDMVAKMRAGQAEGMEISEQKRRIYAHWDRERVMTNWRAHYNYMCNLFERLDPRQRIGWFGPDMSARSMATARQMETWAHGQDLYDLAGVNRQETDSVCNICEIGVRTFRWSFVNRKLEVPQVPLVELTAASDAVWRWNENVGSGAVRGPAVDFALVVTQRRNVADTSLVCEGENARAWMGIAQCFAGPPLDGPRPGERVQGQLRARR